MMRLLEHDFDRPGDAVRVHRHHGDAALVLGMQVLFDKDEVASPVPEREWVGEIATDAPGKYAKDCLATVEQAGAGAINSPTDTPLLAPSCQNAKQTDSLSCDRSARPRQRRRGSEASVGGHRGRGIFGRSAAPLRNRFEDEYNSARQGGVERCSEHLAIGARRPGRPRLLRARRVVKFNQDILPLSQRSHDADLTRDAVEHRGQGAPSPRR